MTEVASTALPVTAAGGALMTAVVEASTSLEIMLVAAEGLALAVDSAAVSALRADLANSASVLAATAHSIAALGRLTLKQ